MNHELFMNVTVVAMSLILAYRRAWRSISGKALILSVITLAITCAPINLVPSVLLPRWLAIALREELSGLRSAELHWTIQDQGIETADMPVFFGNYLVETVSLVRIDPALYKFSVHYSKDNPLPVNEWREKLDATVVVNGSYYHPNLEADTPLWTAGVRFGPERYISQHGMFVADDPPRIVDLLNRDIDSVTTEVKDAMVSYPLLLDAQGEVRAQGRHDWVANRTFVAVDQEQRIILGTTTRGFFALNAFGHFLKNSELKLRVALNFDGGPVACQSISAGTFKRDVYGQWELQHRHTFARVIHQALSSFEYGPIDRTAWRLPIVLAVHKRKNESTKTITPQS